jgi:phosphoserine phosphatase RsbU/P
MITDERVVDVSQDWLQACFVQERLMRAPARASGWLDTGVSCRQLCALGGDCYDFIWLPDGRLTFLVGDASGKGAAAALMMAGVQASLRTASLFTGDDLPALLRAANLQVCFSSPAGRYATLFCGVLDPATRTLRYVNAGHNPPLVVHTDGSIDRLEPTGAPVGLFSSSAWEEEAIRLRCGDRVLVYTDGVTEASSPSGHEWGVEGLLGAAQGRGTESAEAQVGAILDAMNDFSGGVPTDDATLAVMRVL